MARVTLIEPKERPGLAALVSRIVGARGGGRLINVYRLLLHTPVIAEAWMNFVSAQRDSSQIDDKLKELAIMRVAILNKTDYILKTHVQSHGPKAGVSPDQIRTLGDWPSSAHFNARERAVLAYVDAMTRNVEVPDAVFEALRPHFTERQLVELSILIGTYNMHSRVMKALRIDPEPGHL